MRCRRFICGSLAVLWVALVASPASAGRFSLSDQTFRARWSSLTFTAGETRVSCAVTIEGSYHSRTIAKVVGSLIGYVNRAVLGTCTGGRATVLRETLPWHITYDSFRGTLPNITEIRIRMIGASFRIEPGFGFVCLMRTTALSPITADVLIEADLWISFRLGAGPIGLTGAFCPVSGSVEGAGTQERAGSTSRITVRLI